MLSLVISFCSRLSFSLLISGSCIGHVDGDYVGSQHLYSEALRTFRLNVDLPVLRRSCPISGGAYEHFKGRAYCRTASVRRWARARRPLHVYEFLLQWLVEVF